MWNSCMHFQISLIEVEFSISAFIFKGLCFTPLLYCKQEVQTKRKNFAFTENIFISVNITSLKPRERV